MNKNTKYWNKQSHMTVELHRSKRRGDIYVGLDMVHSTIWSIIPEPGRLHKIHENIQIYRTAGKTYEMSMEQKRPHSQA
jgi:hypothetical protein